MQATFPHLALWQEVQFSLTGQSLEGRQSISGAETVIPTLRGRWSASASFVLKGEGGIAMAGLSCADGRAHRHHAGSGALALAAKGS
ncbi:hypothetical protein QWZ10_10530 [Paracoccus cavernae]|uniref:Uncharacterized protein n=1 Tax=Paracoccus cavernae TaxID=1571207 RepID=A0ABT8D5R4_9RHOB|nr:hypothetical protein [Paracoccus cavernae]